MRRLWLVNVTLAAGCIGVGSLDAAGGHWWAAGVMTGSAAVNGLIGRLNYHRQAARQESHHPDYAKIAQLEIELGLVEPPKPPPQPRVNASVPNGLYSGYVPSTYVQPRVIAKPDHPCSLCIPGRPPRNGCPFWPVCQQ